MELKLNYIDPELIDLCNGITYERAELSFFEKVKIFFRFMKEPPRVRIKSKLPFEILPKVKAPKLKHHIRSVK